MAWIDYAFDISPQLTGNNILNKGVLMGILNDHNPLFLFKQILEPHEKSPLDKITSVVEQRLSALHGVFFSRNQNRKRD